MKLYMRLSGKHAVMWLSRDSGCGYISLYSDVIHSTVL